MLELTRKRKRTFTVGPITGIDPTGCVPHFSASNDDAETSADIDVDGVLDGTTCVFTLSSANTDVEVGTYSAEVLLIKDGEPIEVETDFDKVYVKQGVYRG